MLLRGRACHSGRQWHVRARSPASATQARPPAAVSPLAASQCREHRRQGGSSQARRRTGEPAGQVGRRLFHHAKARRFDIGSPPCSRVFVCRGRGHEPPVSHAPSSPAGVREGRIVAVARRTAPPAPEVATRATRPPANSRAPQGIHVSSSPAAVQLGKERPGGVGRLQARTAARGVALQPWQGYSRGSTEQRQRGTSGVRV